MLQSYCMKVTFDDGQSTPNYDSWLGWSYFVNWANINILTSIPSLLLNSCLVLMHVFALGTTWKFLKEWY